MRLKAKANGKVVDRLMTMRSLHFVRPIEGPRGPLSVVFEDEAEWALKFHEMRVLSPAPKASPLLVTREESPHLELLRVPCWEVVLRIADGPRPDGPRDGDRMLLFTVDVGGAYMRHPLERVGEQWIPGGVAADRRADLARSERERLEEDGAAELERIERSEMES